MSRLIEPKDVASIQARIATIIARNREQAEAEWQEKLRGFTGICTRCFDTGIVFERRHAAKPEVCTCEKAAEIERKRVAEIEQALLAKSGLTPRTRKFTLDSYPDKESDAHQDTTAYVEGFDGEVGLILQGPTGRGKTSLAISAGRAILHNRVVAGDERFSLRFISYPDLIDTLYAGVDDHSYLGVLSMYKQCSLFVLDDAGSREKPTAWQLEQLFDITNYRYEHLLPTIVTTNCERSELRQRVGERTADRWLESCMSIGFTGQPNLRQRRLGGAK